MPERLARGQHKGDTPGTLRKARLENVGDEDHLCWGSTGVPAPLTVSIPGFVKLVWS